jgi:hypothetical protein
MKRNLNMKTMMPIHTRAASDFLGRFLPKRSRAKYAAVAIVGMLGVVLSVSDASAFSCARSAFGAGCTGPRGAVGINRHGVVAVGRHGNVYAYRRGSTCYWHNNQRICP